MSSPRFLTLDEVVVIHQMQLAEFGGATGTRDPGMLESAINRPVNRHLYEGPTIPQLASDYAFEIARNHPFVDGNKRAAFMSAYTFLGLNGYDFDAPEAEVVVTILALAAGELSEAELSDWFSQHSKPIP